MEKLSYLPRVDKDKLKIWDDQREACCGYMNKRAGKGSTLSKGKWQKRWFVLKTQISGHENYTLSYYHSPEDKTPRQSFPLDDANVMNGGGGNLLHSFQLICSDGTNVMLGCDSEDQMQDWILTLNYVIQVATERGKIQRDRWGSAPSEKTRNYTRHQVESNQNNNNNNNNNNNMNNNNNNNNNSIPITTLPGSSRVLSPTLGLSNQYNNININDNNSPFYLQNNYLSVRLDIDITTIPPGSTQRNQFEDMFCGDICRTLNIHSNMIQIHSLSPTPGMDWLTLVTFDIFITDEYMNLSEYDIEQMNEDSQKQNEMNQLFYEKRAELISQLIEYIQNPTSILYNGFVTCNIDPSYTQGLLQIDSNSKNDDYEIYSSSSIILNILQKYQTIRIPTDSTDLSHFRIYLSFENKIKSLNVPNPLILRAKYCVIWPYEVKKAIGMMGNMQELWIEPVGLVPKGLPKNLSEPIYFERSKRLNDNIIIPANKLKADLCYDVICHDTRSEILKTLTEEERLQIKQTFESYDTDGNDYISRNELENLVKIRIKNRKELIDIKFNESITENPSDDNYIKAEEFRRQHYQQLQETQNKLLKMYQAADIDGDGKINYSEFLLTEAWWLRCTLNPEHATLF